MASNEIAEERTEKDVLISNGSPIDTTVTSSELRIVGLIRGLTN